MGYIGNRPTAVPLTSADIQDGVITAADLGANSVDSSELVDNSVTLAKMAGLARGKLIYGDASGDPAALAVGSANEVLTHDGTDFDWAAAGGGDNTPYFRASLTATWEGLTADTITLANFNATYIDPAGVWDTTNKRFTAGTAGYYLINFRARMYCSVATATVYCYIYKNGSEYCRVSENTNSTTNNSCHGGACIVYLDGSSDYIDARVKFTSGPYNGMSKVGDATYIEGWKLIT